MIKIEYLADYSGASRFGTCAGCSKGNKEDPQMVRVTFWTGSRHGREQAYVCAKNAGVSCIKRFEVKMCKFCDRLDAIIYFDKQEKELGREYTAAIVTRTWRKDQGKRCSSRSVSFRNQGIGFALNFCPECGKKLKRQGKYSVKTDFKEGKKDGKD